MPIPLTLVIPWPDSPPMLKGRHSTTPPFGRRTSICLTDHDHELIKQAAEIVTGGSVSLFLRVCGYNTARAVLQAVEDDNKRQKDLLNANNQ